MPKAITDKLRKKFQSGTRRNTDVTFKAASSEEITVVKKALGSDELPDGYIAGWASTPDLDLAWDVIAPGAFDKSIAAKGLSGPGSIKLLLQHRSDQPAGVIKVLEMRGQKLWIEAQLNLAISYVKDYYEAAKMNDGLSFSVGFNIVDYEWKNEDTRDEYLLIKEGTLVEVSAVTFPCNTAAEMTFIKNFDEDSVGVLITIAEFEKALVATGLASSRNDAQRLTRAVKQNAELFAAQPEPEQPLSASETKAVSSFGDAVAKLRELMA